jgi:dihydropteroate synthase
MGIINVTPDSFSGDGLGTNIKKIADQAQRFEFEGADFLDLGAESTRPGHLPVSVKDELERLIPAIQAVAPKVSIPISVDTYKSEVARQSLEEGASIINDIWGGNADPNIIEIAARFGAPVILMHNQEYPIYTDLITDIKQNLTASRLRALDCGIANNNIILDPGIGFAKTPDHNLEILKRLADFKTIGNPILIGASRKSTIGLVLDLPVEDRLEGTAATVALSIAAGADIIRAHDVKEMCRVSKMSDAIIRGWRPDNWMK